MTKKTNKILTVFLIIVLLLTSLIELANLVGFGTQEIYLNHSGYPEGEKYKSDVASEKLMLAIWTIVTIGLLIMTFLSRFKKRTDWLNWIALTVFILATYLPIMTIINGLFIRGIIMGVIIIGLVGLIVLKIKKENTKSYIPFNTGTNEER